MKNIADICSAIDHFSFAGVRDWCMLTMAFFGLLRIGEYCGGGLRMQDVTLFSWGICICIPFSKTTPHPTEIRIAARGDKDILCPARALRNYIRWVHPTLTNTRAAPLFLKHPTDPSATPVSADAFTQRIHDFALFLRLDPSRFAGHSLRRGGATALYIAGVPEAIIQQHGRWRSLVVRRYMESSSYYQLIPTILLLHKTSDLFLLPKPKPSQ